MNTPYDGGCAYPVPMFTRQADGQPMTAAEFFEGGNGMTLRDYFAAKALTGYFAAPYTAHQCDGAKVAQYCYEIADAMLAARAK